MRYWTPDSTCANSNAPCASVTVRNEPTQASDGVYAHTSTPGTGVPPGSVSVPEIWGTDGCGAKVRGTVARSGPPVLPGQLKSTAHPAEGTAQSTLVEPDFVRKRCTVKFAENSPAAFTSADCEDPPRQVVPMPWQMETVSPGMNSVPWTATTSPSTKPVSGVTVNVRAGRGAKLISGVDGVDEVPVGSAGVEQDA